MHIFLKLESGKPISLTRQNMAYRQHNGVSHPKYGDGKGTDKMSVLVTACGAEIHTGRDVTLDKLVQMSETVILCKKCKDHPMYSMWLLNKTQLD